MTAPRLVADIGGTSARFGLVDGDGARPRDERVLATDDHPGIAAAVEAYLAATGGPRPRQAAVAVASPIVGDEVQLTNNPWTFSIAATRQALGLERLLVLNDFTALALSLPVLGDGDTEPLGAGEPDVESPVALLGPGTGLGVSALVPAGDGRWIPLATEGGHRDLAATTPREWDVVVELSRRFGRASTERVLSGPGLSSLHAALAAIDGEAPVEIEPEMISAGAAAGDRRAVETMTLFAGWLGAVAGDLVLTLGARGGLYVGGGIVPRLGPLFDRDTFLRRLRGKGRFADYLAAVPVRLITHPTPALLGAARALAS